MSIVSVSLDKSVCIRPVQIHMSQSRDLPASHSHPPEGKCEHGAEGSSRDPPHTLLNPIVGSRISHTCGLSCPRKSIFHNVNDVCFSTWPFRAKAEDRRRRTYRSSASSFVMFGAAPPCFAKWLRRATRLRSKRVGGAERDRTDDLKLAKLALSQLSYSPV